MLHQLVKVASAEAHSVVLTSDKPFKGQVRLQVFLSGPDGRTLCIMLPNTLWVALVSC
jgi:hypothetical protein